MDCKNYKWYVGVPHCHTVASYVGLTLEQLTASSALTLFLSPDSYTSKFTTLPSHQESQSKKEWACHL